MDAKSLQQNKHERPRKTASSNYSPNNNGSIGKLITPKLEKALEKVEPSKTFSAAQLSGTVDAIIRSIQLETKTDIDPVQTRNGEIFNDHTMRLRTNGVNVNEFINSMKI